MQITTILAAAAGLITLALAQTTTTSASVTSSSTASASASTTADLDSLVSELPSCGIDCLESSAKDVNCSVTDLTCLCDESTELASSIAPCILTSSCSGSEQNELISVAEKICEVIGSSNSSEIAAASSYVASEVASASASETATSSASGNLAVATNAPVAGMGVMGAAAALAVLAL